MTVKAKLATGYIKEFARSIEASAQQDWLKDLRRKAFEYFTETGFPTSRDEDWKYTDVKEVAGGQWSVANHANAISESAGNAVNKIVFVDGIYSEDASSLGELPEGVVVSKFAESGDNEVFQENLSKIVEPEFSGFSALNTAFIDQGLFIHVPKNTKIDEPIHVVMVSTGEFTAFPRLLYVGEEGSEAEVLEVFTREFEGPYLTNAVSEVKLEKNAKLIHTRVQRESHAAFHIGVTKAVLSRDSVYDGTNLNLGGKLARHDANLEFTEENGEAWVDGLYLIEDGQHTDTHSRIDHKVKNCLSHQNYKGILDGKSRAVFNGKVYVHENASGTDAEQSNKNLLLSNDARVDTKPQLEIFNDDVKCAHGATVGQLEGEELFYLLTRGLNQDLARNLLTYGFAEEIINKITVPSIKQDLDEAVLNRLHAKL